MQNDSQSFGIDELSAEHSESYRSRGARRI